MKLVLILATATFLICSCSSPQRQQREPAPFESFSVEVIENIEQSDSIVKKLKVSFSGHPIITIKERSETFERIPLSTQTTPQITSKLQSVFIRIFAEMNRIDHSNTDQIHYTYEIIPGVGRYSSPASADLSVPKGQQLSDYVRLTIKDGEYSLGDSVTLGEIAGSFLILYVH